MTTSPIAGAGLFLDVAGAALLASGLMFKGNAEMLDEAATKVGFNMAVYLSLRRQRIDVTAGFILLAIGFALQFDGTTSWQPKWATWPIAIGTAVLVIALALAIRYAMTRSMITTAVSEQVLGQWRGQLAEAIANKREFDRYQALRRAAMFAKYLPVASAATRCPVPHEAALSHVYRDAWPALESELVVMTTRATVARTGARTGAHEARTV